MHKIFSEFKKLNSDTYKIMKYGVFFSALICLISVAILMLYIFLGINLLYHLGLILMKASFIFAVEFIICGIIVDFIKNRGI